MEENGQIGLLFDQNPVHENQNPGHEKNSILDPCASKNNHKEWENVLHIAYHVFEKHGKSEPFNLMALLRERGVELRREVRNEVVSYNVYRGEVPVEEWKGEIITKYLEPYRELVKKILALAAFEGRVEK